MGTVNPKVEFTAKLFRDSAIPVSVPLYSCTLVRAELVYPTIRSGQTMQIFNRIYKKGNKFVISIVICYLLMNLILHNDC